MGHQRPQGVCRVSIAQRLLKLDLLVYKTHLQDYQKTVCGGKASSTAPTHRSTEGAIKTVETALITMFTVKISNDAYGVRADMVV